MSRPLVGIIHIVLDVGRADSRRLCKKTRRPLTVAEMVPSHCVLRFRLIPLSSARLGGSRPSDQRVSVMGSSKHAASNILFIRKDLLASFGKMPIFETAGSNCGRHCRPMQGQESPARQSGREAGDGASAGSAFRPRDRAGRPGSYHGTRSPPPIDFWVHPSAPGLDAADSVAPCKSR